MLLVHTVTLPTAALPALPETVDSWLTACIDAEAQNAHLHRRSGNRWTRLKTWSRERDGEISEWCVDQVSRYVAERGSTDFRLERKDVDPIEWRSDVTTVLTVDEVLAPERGQPLDLVLTNALVIVIIKLANEVRESARVMPQLITSLGEALNHVAKVQREASAETQPAKIQEIKAGVQLEKLDRVLGVLEKVTGDKKPAAGTAKPNTPAGVVVTAADLLAALTEDDRNALLDTPEGRLLAIATTQEDLRKRAEAIWQLHRDKRLVLSPDSLLAARKLLGYA